MILSYAVGPVRETGANMMGSPLPAMRRAAELASLSSVRVHLGSHRDRVVATNGGAFDAVAAVNSVTWWRSSTWRWAARRRTPGAELSGRRNQQWAIVTIEPADSPDADAILGGNFPPQDEMSYLREAQSQSSSAQSAGGARDVVGHAGRFTQDSFRGGAGTALADSLASHRTVLEGDMERHQNVAGWLKLGAANIVHTKNSMNHVVGEFDSRYRDMVDQAGREGWTQKQLTEGRDRLLAESQGRVSELRKVFDGRHQEVRDGIVHGSTPPKSQGDTGIHMMGGDERMRVPPNAAERDVHDALAGDQDAAARVKDVLDSISEKQRNGEALDPRQGAYLSQMQAQQHGMSVSELATAERRLGDNKGVIADSWQLMGSDKIRYPKTDLNVGAIENQHEWITGGYDKLPRSLQSTLDRSAVQTGTRITDDYEAVTKNASDVSKIARMVSDGNESLQRGTPLDAKLLQWSQKTLTGDVGPLLTQDYTAYREFSRDRDGTLGDVFTAAGRDHIAVHDVMTGSAGQDFLRDLHLHTWDDSRAVASTHSLFDWIGHDANSQDPVAATRAAESAHALAQSIDANQSELLTQKHAMWGQTGIGQFAPDLVRADATALEPFQAALIGDNDRTPGFALLGHPERGDFSAAQNVFAVIDSDPDAAKHFTAAAAHKIVDYQASYAHGAAQGHPHVGDMRNAAGLLGVLDKGADMEASARGLDGEAKDQAIYNMKKAGLEMFFGATDVDKIPGFGMTKEALETGLLGTPAGSTASHNAPVHTVQQGIDMMSWQVASALSAQPSADIPAEFFVDGKLLSPDQISQNRLIDYSNALQDFLGHRNLGGMQANYALYFNHAAGVDTDGSDDPPR